MQNLKYNSAQEIVAAITAQPVEQMALLFDWDGTLTDFENDPEKVRLPDEVLADLKLLYNKLSGAVGLVTGRDPQYIDRKGLPDFPIPGSFEHGGSIRLVFDGSVKHSAASIQIEKLDKLLAEEFLSEGVWIEQKPSARAVHWNKSPFEDIAQEHAHALVERVVAKYNADVSGDDQITFIKGRKVLEIGSVTATKGYGLNALMQMLPFQGRMPVYPGDQPADESAMDAAHKHEGITIGVGPDSPLTAQYRVKAPAEIHKIIHMLAHHAEWKAKEAPSLTM